MQHFLSEACHWLCLLFVAGCAVSMIFPRFDLRQFLDSNKKARLKAMVHLRDYKDDLQMLIERTSPAEVEALIAAHRSGEKQGSFDVPRWPTEQKPHLLLTLQGLIKSATRELRAVLTETAAIAEVGRQNPERLLGLQCRLESIKFEALACIPDLEVEAEGLRMARERFKDLLAYGLSLSDLNEKTDNHSLRFLVRLVITPIRALCFLRSSREERLEMSASKECNRKIEKALTQWRQEVMPQIEQVFSREVGITCEAATESMLE